MADDDLWHVRISPDEVKQLTLEQVDDLFRLEVIEASTLIWQPGMSEWLPLSVVAGLGDDEPETVNIPVSEPPPATTKRMAQTATSWPPQVAAPAPSWPPQPARSAPPPSAPPPPSMRPAPPSSRSAAPAPVASSWPPPAAWSNPPPRPGQPISAFASTVAEQAYRSAPPPSAPPPPSSRSAAALIDPFAPPTSTAPYASSPMSHTQRHARSGGGAWVIIVAFAAGAAVTLYRNDLVHAAARSMGQEASFFKLEQALGGPSFGTPRAVAQMAAAAASITAAVAPTAPSMVDTPSVPAAPSTPGPTATTATAAPTATSAPAPTTTATSEPAPTATAQADAPREAPKPAVAPPSHPAAASRPAAARPAPEAVDPVFKTPKKGKRGKGNEYDPLNPSL